MLAMYEAWQAEVRRKRTKVTWPDWYALRESRGFCFLHMGEADTLAKLAAFQAELRLDAAEWLKAEMAFAAG